MAALPRKADIDRRSFAEITAALKAAEIRRAELIDMVNPRAVSARNC
jgi:hypothetical protein